LTDGHGCGPGNTRGASTGHNSAAGVRLRRFIRRSLGEGGTLKSFANQSRTGISLLRQELKQDDSLFQSKPGIGRRLWRQLAVGCIADCQSAGVSLIQTVSIPPIGNRRHSRLTTCATIPPRWGHCWQPPITDWPHANKSKLSFFLDRRSHDSLMGYFTTMRIPGVPTCSTHFEL
jgi:hypothetical protein